MTLPQLGHAVIVNNVHSEMPGSQRDVEALEAAYEAAGFTVHTHRDCDTDVSYGFISICFSQLAKGGKACLSCQRRRALQFFV